MIDHISRRAIVSRVAEVVGLEKAEKLIDEAISATNLIKKEYYSEEEAIQFLEEVKKNKGMISILACLIIADIHLKKIE